MKVKVLNLDGSASKADIELADAVFGIEPRADILHRVVTWQLENRRGTARGARERSDVARTGKKFGNQKGGGTARHGDRAAPIFIGGGKAHGPRVRDFDPSLNKKIRALGLKMALSAKANWGKKVLVMDGDAVNAMFARAARNLVGIEVMPAMGANVYDILKHDTLVLTRAAVEKLEARFNG